MVGKKVFSNEKRLLKVAGIGWVIWTGCCILVLLSVLREFDTKKRETAALSGVEKIIEEAAEQGRRFGPPPGRLIESKGKAVFVVFLGWALVGGGVAYGGYFAFWKAEYRVDYEGSVIEIAHSWPRKQLFVDGELQDERADFDYGTVDLHGRIKRGDANGQQVRVSFARFGSSTPICVVVNHRVVFRG
jgi:hypothetical protein